MSVMTQDRTVSAVHWQRGYAIDDAGVIGDITAFYDDEGDVVEFAGASFAVVRWRDTNHLSRLDIADFEIIRTH